MKIGIIGAGHIAGYMLEGFAKSGLDAQIMLAAPHLDRVSKTARIFQCTATTHNQELIDFAQLVILAVRPADLKPALDGVSFKSGQSVACLVAGTRLKEITSLVSPATAIRVLPISCAAIGKSPVLVFPENSLIEKVFSCLGQVHTLPDETVFSPGTAMVGAFYAWLFPFMDAMVSWTENQGFDPETARSLVVETIEGACGMARHQKDMSLADIWETLATPGGISELGARVLEDEDAVAAWPKALDAVRAKMRHPDKK